MTTSTALKKPAPKDWHAADVIAAVRKAGWSLQQLAFAHGYKARTVLTNALRSRYPRAEKIIADTLEKKPGEIWPSRYQADLITPNSQSGATPRRPAISLVKATTPRSARNPQKQSGKSA
jgi:Ner family transcriptional regulator